MAEEQSGVGGVVELGFRVAGEVEDVDAAAADAVEYLAGCGLEEDDEVLFGGVEGCEGFFDRVGFGFS